MAGQLAKKVEFSQIGRVWDELRGELARVAILPIKAENRFIRKKMRFDQNGRIKSAIFSPRSSRAEPQIFSPCRVAGQLAKKVEFSQIGRVWDELRGELARVAILPTKAEYRFKRKKNEIRPEWLN